MDSLTQNRASGFDIRLYCTLTEYGDIIHISPKSEIPKGMLDMHLHMKFIHM